MNENFVEKRKVVVTGIGALTPLGVGVENSWSRLINCESSVKKIRRFDVANYAVKIASEVIHGEGENEFNPLTAIPSPKEVRRTDRFIQYALCAAKEAVEDSGWKASNDDEKSKTGVLIGSGIGGLETIFRYSHIVGDNWQKKVSPFFIPASLINLASGHVAMTYGYTGVNTSIVSACASATHAIGEAMRYIQYGDADVIVAGGTEAAVCEPGVVGFAAMKALASNYNEDPERASRPWDTDRSGFVIGEGAGIVVLEEYEHAKKRGAKIYAELKGYGFSGDAYHITAPHPEGKGARLCVQKALNSASLNVEDIDYINAHGTSTGLGDKIELKTMQDLFADKNPDLVMSSTKSSIGHLLGAAGGIEAIFAILAIQNNVCPATLNLDNPIEGVRMNLAPKIPFEKEINCVLSNSFGFGGTNASIILSKI